ncbi:MAG TPA: helix-turn-helix transcriptional regulator [Candidatus Megaira endosymbiont of Hartmannula sinica]|nr:helix-turn-helix transcriptional regulator [Candidatus Megaera endosymbiont of Hartmannula sinica]
MRYSRNTTIFPQQEQQQNNEIRNKTFTFSKDLKKSKREFIVGVDEYIGKKLSFLRISSGISRISLSEIIGVTPQQLQKYEKGTNRISISRLLVVANFFNTNINYFCKDISDFIEVNYSDFNKFNKDRVIKMNSDQNKNIKCK